MVGIALGTTEHQARYTHPELLEAVQRIEFTQHGWPAEGVQQAAINMPDLTLCIQQFAVGIVEPLHTTFATPALVRLLYPLALLAPVKIEARLPILGYSHQTLPLTQYINPPHGIERQEVEAFLDPETGGAEFFFDRVGR